MIRDADNRPVQLPYLGEKTLIIFYVDPDHPYQNQQFTDYLEEHQIDSKNIFAFGVANLKDAPLLPNAVVRAMIRSKVSKTGADIFTDPNHLLHDAWNLGNVNNKFTIIIVNPDREIVFLRKGVMEEEDQEEFFRVVNQYK